MQLSHINSQLKNNHETSKSKLRCQRQILIKKILDIESDCLIKNDALQNDHIQKYPDEIPPYSVLSEYLEEINRFTYIFTFVRQILSTEEYHVSTG
jgi:hypothetical protein